MPLLTALGIELETWPPYISNLVFELWELSPPTVSPQNNMAAGSSTSAGAAAAAAPPASPGSFMVRVLYNKQPLQLPGAAEGDPHILEFSHFRENVLAPFILSEQEHEQACRSSISHDGALPQPEAEDEEWSLSSAGSSKAQQEQPPVAPAEQVHQPPTQQSQPKPPGHIQHKL
eukprot:gene8609-8790_t